VHTVDTSHSPYSAIFRKKEEDLFLFDLIMRVIMNEVGGENKNNLEYDDNYCTFAAMETGERGKG
jgi:hypothetical protein